MNLGRYKKDLEKLGKTEVLSAAPELYDDLIIVWEMFIALSSARQIGFRACPITITDIKNILDFYKIEDEEERADYLEFILALDHKLLNHADTSTSNK